VRVAPLGAVELADIVATNKGDCVVDDQQLAVIAGIGTKMKARETTKLAKPS
jgi:hypothetical protein